MFGALSLKDGYVLLFCSYTTNNVYDLTYHNLKKLIVLCHLLPVKKITYAKSLHKLGIKCQLLVLCDYMRHLLKLCYHTRTMSRKSKYEYGVLYQYGDACTRVAIFLTYILGTYAVSYVDSQY